MTGNPAAPGSAPATPQPSAITTRCGEHVPTISRGRPHGNCLHGGRNRHGGACAWRRKDALAERVLTAGNYGRLRRHLYGMRCAAFRERPTAPAADGLYSNVTKLRRAFLAVALAVLACCALGAPSPAARADGDPGSDVLVYQNLFVASDANISIAQQVELGDLLTSAQRERLHHPGGDHRHAGRPGRDHAAVGEAGQLRQLPRHRAFPRVRAAAAGGDARRIRLQLAGALDRRRLQGARQDRRQARRERPGHVGRDRRAHARLRFGRLAAAAATAGRAAGAGGPAGRRAAAPRRSGRSDSQSGGRPAATGRRPAPRWRSSSASQSPPWPPASSAAGSRGAAALPARAGPMLGLSALRKAPRLLARSKAGPGEGCGWPSPAAGLPPGSSRWQPP